MISLEGSRKRKRSSAFRIKTGSIVAYRIGCISKPFDVILSQSASSEQRNNGDDVLLDRASAKLHVDFNDKTSYAMVWTSPIPHRDLYWSLIGKRVRCCLPHLSPPNGGNRQETIQRSSDILEGEIIRMRSSFIHRTKPVPRTDSKHPPDFIVDLLMDTESLQAHPLLKSVSFQDYTMGLSKLKESARRSFELEQQVARGGADKSTQLVVVRVALQYPSFLDDSTVSDSVVAASAEKNGQGPVDDEEGYCIYVRKWVMQKCIPLHRLTNSRRTISSCDGSNGGSSEMEKGIYLSEVGANGEARIHVDEIQEKQGLSNGARCYTSSKKSEIHMGKLGSESLSKLGSEKDSFMSNGQSSFDISQTEIPRVDGLPRKNVDGAKEKTKATKLSRLKGKQARLQYLGDSNDTPNQQMQNWRWLASRYHDLLYETRSRERCLPNDAVSALPSIMDSFRVEILSAGFIGEVLNVDPGAAPSETLAMVTIRRLFLPEHTMTGRTDSHSWNDVSLDFDVVSEQEVSYIMKIPIEQLVIVCRQMPEPQSKVNSFDESADNAVIRSSYSWTRNIFDDCSGSTSNLEIANVCHRCRWSGEEPSGLVLCEVADCCAKTARFDSGGQCIAWCRKCLDALDVGGVNSIALPCCRGICDCNVCAIDSESNFHLALESRGLEPTISESCSIEAIKAAKLNFNPFSRCASYLRYLHEATPVKFSLPPDFLYSIPSPVPQSKPLARSIRKTGVLDEPRPHQLDKLAIGRLSPRPLAAKNLSAKRSLDGASANGVSVNATETKGVLLLKRNRCARQIVYKPSKKYWFKSQDVDNDQDKANSEKPRSVRENYERSAHLLTEQKDESAKISSSSRAARVTQRRLLKDVASFGFAASSYMGLFDTLANREPQLRFGRSKIHAWGVFADSAIAAGEMIVEYRGELIGNAVAERREIDYEAAKIGSDYMFRIDSLNVCDATKQGNVARFINASCDPNCYTKIITFDGTKRIVIYAKKDIEAGDELCYDYKFPLEYDETKRILCHCGARECRGYMNWVCQSYEFCLSCCRPNGIHLLNSPPFSFFVHIQDKRYVVLPSTAIEQNKGLTVDHKPIKCAAEE